MRGHRWLVLGIFGLLVLAACVAVRPRPPAIVWPSATPAPVRGPLIQEQGAGTPILNRNILIPLYGYPEKWQTPAVTDTWTLAAAANFSNTVMAIIDPICNSWGAGKGGGPTCGKRPWETPRSGTGAPDSNMTAGMQELAAAGVLQLGYVSTYYGAQALADVEGQIDIYAAAPYTTWIDGIYFDEVSRYADNWLTKYVSITQYAYAAGFNYVVIGINGWDQQAENYFNPPIANQAILFEDFEPNWETYLSPSGTHPDWMLNYDRGNFIAIVLAVPDYRLALRLLEAYDRNYGTIFITDAASYAAAYDTSPAYLNSEVALWNARVGGTLQPTSTTGPTATPGPYLSPTPTPHVTATTVPSQTPMPTPTIAATPTPPYWWTDNEGTPPGKWSYDDAAATPAYGATVVAITDTIPGATFTANDYYGDNTPSMAGDGNDTTWWNCNGGGLASWLRVDLGSPQAIIAFRIKQYTPYHATSWKIQYSTDLATWADAYSGSTADDTGRVNFAAAITARYWQLIPMALNTSPYWDIYTFDLWQPLSSQAYKIYGSWAVDDWGRGGLGHTLTTTATKGIFAGQVYINNYNGNSSQAQFTPIRSLGKYYRVDQQDYLDTTPWKLFLMPEGSSGYGTDGPGVWLASASEFGITLTKIVSGTQALNTWYPFEIVWNFGNAANATSWITTTWAGMTVVISATTGIANRLAGVTGVYAGTYDSYIYGTKPSVNLDDYWAVEGALTTPTPAPQPYNPQAAWPELPCAALTVTVDAALTEWAAVTPYTLTLATAAYSWPITPTVPAGLAGLYRCAHNGALLYLSGVITDTTVISPTGSLENGDAARIVLDGLADGDFRHLLDDHDVLIGSNGAARDFEFYPIGATTAVSRTVAGWQWEMSLPLATLQANTAAGTIVGLTFGYNDSEGAATWAHVLTGEKRAGRLE